MKNLFSEFIEWLSSISIANALIMRMVLHFILLDKRAYLEANPTFKHRADWIAYEFWFFGVYRIMLIYVVPPMMMLIALIQPVEEQVVSPINGIIILCIYAFGTGLYFDRARKKHDKIPNPFKKSKSENTH